MRKVELFVIDDHPVFLEGVKKLFNREKDGIHIGGWAKSIADARKKIKSSTANIVFLDLVLPGESGVDFCRELKNGCPEKKVIALTGETDPFILYRAYQNEADAIISKLSDKAQLLEAIDGVLKGKRIIGSGVPSFFDKKSMLEEQPFLTKREFEVMNLLVIGVSRKKAAQILHVSEDTIHKHCDNVFKKFGVNKLSEYIQVVNSLNAKR